MLRLCYRLLPFILWNCWISIADGQDVQNDTIILLKAFKEVTLKEQIVYVENLASMKGVFKQLPKIIKNGKIENTVKGPYANTIVLSKDEQKYIIAKLKSDNDIPDSYFPKGKRILADSIWEYLDKENEARNNKISEAIMTKDTIALINLKYDYSWVFCFKTPIYFRENSFCLISYVAWCGKSCGRKEASFYKKENGQWKRWLIFSEGDF